MSQRNLAAKYLWSPDRLAARLFVSAVCNKKHLETLQNQEKVSKAVGNKRLHVQAFQLSKLVWPTSRALGLTSVDGRGCEVT